MPTRPAPRRAPAKRKRGPLTLTPEEAKRVRAVILRMHGEHGSDAEVAKLAGLAPVTVYRVRTEACPAGRKVAVGIASAIGCETTALLDGSAS